MLNAYHVPVSTKYTLVNLILPIIWKTNTNISILHMEKLKNQMGGVSCAVNGESKFGSVSDLFLVLSSHHVVSWEDGA